MAGISVIAVGTAPAAASTYWFGPNLSAGFVAPGQTARHCTAFVNGDELTGPIAASGHAGTANQVITTVSTDIYRKASDGLVYYCATFRNDSGTTASLGAAIRVYASLTEPNHSTDLGWMAPGATVRKCWTFNNRSDVGPIVAGALPDHYGVAMETVSTDMENRAGYGWVYCATFRNTSTTQSTNALATVNGGLHNGVGFNPPPYMGYLEPGETGQHCWRHRDQTKRTVAVNAAARQTNVRLTTVSTDSEYRAGYGQVFCATIRNDSSRGSDVDLRILAFDH
jgi:hypothetical protein